jgi:hypothetical protein
MSCLSCSIVYLVLTVSPDDRYPNFFLRDQRIWASRHGALNGKK